MKMSYLSAGVLHVSPIVRVTNLVIAFVFTVTSTTYGVPRALWDSKGAENGKAQSAELFQFFLDPAKIVVPENFGTVTERFTSAGTENSKKLIIQIQDSHCNFEAQTNISKIIESMTVDKDVAKSLKLIATEGAQGAVDPVFERSLPDPKIRQETSDYFVKIGWLTGTETYAINFKEQPLPLWGIEDKSLYNENLDCFRKAKTGLEKEKAFIERMTNLIDVLKLQVFSKGLGSLVKMRDDWDKNVVQFTDYCSYIEKLAREHGLGGKGTQAFKDPVNYPNFTIVMETMEIENKIDTKKIDAERKMLIEELQKNMVKEELSELIKQSLYLRIGKTTSDMFYSFLKSMVATKKIDMTKYPNLAGYMEIVLKSSKVNAGALFEEVDRIEKAIKSKMYSNNAEKQLDETIDQVKVMRNLLDLRMTRRDLSYYNENKRFLTPDELIRRVARVADETGMKNSASGALAWLEANKQLNVAACEGFYVAALKRDTVLVENTIKEMEKRKATAVAFVTGGFHTQGAKELFKAKGYSYVVVTPRMTEKYDDKYYLARMLNEQSEFDKLFANTGNRLAAWTMIGSVLLDESYATMALANNPGNKQNWIQALSNNAQLISILKGIDVRKEGDVYTLALKLADGSVTTRQFKVVDGGIQFVEGSILVGKATKLMTKAEKQAALVAWSKEYPMLIVLKDGKYVIRTKSPRGKTVGILEQIMADPEKAYDLWAKERVAEYTKELQRQDVLRDLVKQTLFGNALQGMIENKGGVFTYRIKNVAFVDVEDAIKAAQALVDENAQTVALLDKARVAAEYAEKYGEKILKPGEPFGDPQSFKGNVWVDIGEVFSCQVSPIGDNQIRVQVYKYQKDKEAVTKLVMINKADVVLPIIPGVPLRVDSMANVNLSMLKNFPFSILLKDSKISVTNGSQTLAPIVVSWEKVVAAPVAAVAQATAAGDGTTAKELGHWGLSSEQLTGASRTLDKNKGESSAFVKNFMADYPSLIRVLESKNTTDSLNLLGLQNTVTALQRFVAIMTMLKDSSNVKIENGKLLVGGELKVGGKRLEVHIIPLKSDVIKREAPGATALSVSTETPDSITIRVYVSSDASPRIMMTKLMHEIVETILKTETAQNGMSANQVHPVVTDVFEVLMGTRPVIGSISDRTFEQFLEKVDETDTGYFEKTIAGTKAKIAEIRALGVNTALEKAMIDHTNSADLYAKAALKYIDRIKGKVGAYVKPVRVNFLLDAADAAHKEGDKLLADKLFTEAIRITDFNTVNVVQNDTLGVLEITMGNRNYAMNIKEGKDRGSVGEIHTGNQLSRIYPSPYMDAFLRVALAQNEPIVDRSEKLKGDVSVKINAGLDSMARGIDDALSNDRTQEAATVFKSYKSIIDNMYDQLLVNGSTHIINVRKIKNRIDAQKIFEGILNDILNDQSLDVTARVSEIDKLIRDYRATEVSMTVAKEAKLALQQQQEALAGSKVEASRREIVLLNEQLKECINEVPVLVAMGAMTGTKQAKVLADKIVAIDKELQKRKVTYNLSGLIQSMPSRDFMQIAQAVIDALVSTTMSAAERTAVLEDLIIAYGRSESKGLYFKQEESRKALNVMKLVDNLLAQEGINGGALATAVFAGDLKNTFTSLMTVKMVRDEMSKLLVKMGNADLTREFANAMRTADRMAVATKAKEIATQEQQKAIEEVYALLDGAKMDAVSIAAHKGAGMEDDVWLTDEEFENAWRDAEMTGRANPELVDSISMAKSRVVNELNIPSGDITKISIRPIGKNKLHGASAQYRTTFNEDGTVRSVEILVSQAMVNEGKYLDANLRLEIKKGYMGETHVEAMEGALVREDIERYAKDLESVDAATRKNAQGLLERLARPLTEQDLINREEKYAKQIIMAALKRKYPGFGINALDSIYNDKRNNKLIEEIKVKRKVAERMSIALANVIANSQIASQAAQEALKARDEKAKQLLLARMEATKRREGMVRELVKDQKEKALTRRIPVLSAGNVFPAIKKSPVSVVAVEEKTWGDWFKEQWEASNIGNAVRWAFAVPTLGLSLFVRMDAIPGEYPPMDKIFSNLEGRKAQDVSKEESSRITAAYPEFFDNYSMVKISDLKEFDLGNGRTSDFLMLGSNIIVAGDVTPATVEKLIHEIVESDESARATQACADAMGEPFTSALAEYSKQMVGYVQLAVSGRKDEAAKALADINAYVASTKLNLKGKEYSLKQVIDMIRKASHGEGLAAEEQSYGMPDRVLRKLLNSNDIPYLQDRINNTDAVKKEIADTAEFLQAIGLGDKAVVYKTRADVMAVRTDQAAKIALIRNKLAAIKADKNSMAGKAQKKILDGIASADLRLIEAVLWDATLDFGFDAGKDISKVLDYLNDGANLQMALPLMSKLVDYEDAKGNVLEGYETGMKSSVDGLMLDLSNALKEKTGVVLDTSAWSGMSVAELGVQLKVVEQASKVGVQFIVAVANDDKNKEKIVTAVEKLKGVTVTTADRADIAQDVTKMVKEDKKWTRFSLIVAADNLQEYAGLIDLANLASLLVSDGNTLTNTDLKLVEQIGLKDLAAQLKTGDLKLLDVIEIKTTTIDEKQDAYKTLGFQA